MACTSLIGQFVTLPCCGHVVGWMSLVLQVVAASWWNLSPFGILLRLMYQQEAGVGHALSMQVRRSCGLVFASSSHDDDDGGDDDASAELICMLQVFFSLDCRDTMSNED